ncbi:MAG: hypothetical protein Q9169_004365 [Polycauliona sp. 2 TL-2023]
MGPAVTAGSFIDVTGNDSRARRLCNHIPANVDAATVLKNVAAKCQVAEQDIEDVYPCTPLQAALMVATALSPETYICHSRYYLSEAVHPERLRSAWETVKATEPILRNRVIWSEHSRSFLQATIARGKVGRSTGKFDDIMTFGQNLTKHKIAQKGKRWIFEIRIHHSIIDGRSMMLLLEKIVKAYASHQLLPPGPSFKSLISCACLEQKDQTRHSRAFWTGYLDGASTLEFPRLPSLPGYIAGMDSTKSVRIPLELGEGVKRCGVSPASILYAATALVLGAHAGKTDVIFGLTLSGRDAPVDGIDDMLGPTIATVPFRTQVNPEVTIEQYLNSVQKQVLDLVPHQHYGLQGIKKLGAGAQAACGYRTHVIVQPSDQTAVDNGILQSFETAAPVVLDDVPLSIEYALGDGQITINCGFDSTYIPDSDLDTVISHLRCILHDITTLQPSLGLARVRLADDHELSQICAWAQEIYPISLPPSVEELYNMSGDVASLGTNNTKYRWVVNRGEGGEVRCAPTLCPGELAFSTADLFHKDRLDMRLFENQDTETPSLETSSMAAKTEFTDVAAHYGTDGRLHVHGSQDRAVLVSEDHSDGLVGRFPETQCELDMEQVFCEVFQIKGRLTIKDQFFQLGAGLATVSFGNGPDRDTVLYAAELVYALPESVDLPMLSHALEIVILRNQIFRTRIIQSSEGAMQVVIKGHSLLMTDSEDKTTLSRDDHLVFGEGKPLMYCHLLPGNDHRRPRLVLSIHHALYDGRTLSQLLSDISYNYFHPRAEMRGRQPHSRFVEHAAAMDQGAAANYWIKQLANLVVAQYPRVPTSFIHQPQARDVLSSKKDFVSTHIRRGGITVATVVAAAWALLLSTYCDTEDVCYATVLSGRDNDFLDDIMGPTIATVPMRVTADMNISIAEYLATVQANLLEMQEYQHYGLNNISRLPDGARNVTKLTSILVMQQDMKRNTVDDGHEDFFTAMDEESQMLTDFPLVVQSTIDAKAGQLELEIRFDNTLLGAREAQRMLRQLHNVVDQLSHFAGSTSGIDFATKEDKAEISAWYPSPLPQSPSLLHELFEETASRQPQSPAIDSTFAASNVYRKLSYRQLDAYATSLASPIAEHDSCSGLPVAVCFSKSPLLVVAMLAVLKSGRAFVPLEASMPTARIRRTIEGLGPNILVITDVIHIERFQGLELVALHEETLQIIWRKRNDTMTSLVFQEASSKEWKAPCRPLPVSTAYILHTSGSTGRPKGIVVSHGTSTTALINLSKMMKIDEMTGVLQLSSLAFDASLMEVFATLISGGCVCMLSNASRLAGDIATAVKEMNVNSIITTPTLASFWDPDRFPTLSTLTLGGESVPSQLIERWLGSKTRPWTIVGYGPAEAGFVCCINTFITAHDPTNVGRPVGCYALIADLHDLDRQAAIGAIGELTVCGPNVSDGYVSQPDSNPFGKDWPGLLDWGQGSLRYYRTGDLARYCDDGSIRIIGRKNLQRKIHGQRRELGEIESLIMSNSPFHGVVVDLFGPSILVAFLELNPSFGPFEGLLPLDAIGSEVRDKLIAGLREFLPAYMIPTVYVPVAHFPTNPSEKTDRGLLRASLEPVISEYRVGMGPSKRQPATTNQTILRQLWADAIAIQPESIGIDDGFFALGGTSVGVIRLLQSVRKRQMKLDVGAVYKVDTLSEMAAMLETTESPSGSQTVTPPFSLMDGWDSEQCITLASERCHVPRSAVLDLYPCSGMQEAMMIVSAKSPGSYAVHSVIRLSASLDRDRLTRSLKSVWRRHDILRTRIFLDDGFRGLQAVLDEPIDISVLEGDVASYCEVDVSHGYGEPLSRCAVVADREVTHLILSQHHAVFDAWSLGLLMEEIKKEYSIVSSTPSIIGQYASHIRAIMQIQKSFDAARYWRDLLSQANTARLPVAEGESFRTNREYKTTIDLPSSPKYALAILVEAAWSVLLGQYTESDDICFGVVQSGRAASISGCDTIIGPTIVSIPRRHRPNGSLLVSEFLAQVQSSTIEAQRWEHYGLGNIRNLSESAYKACKFQSMVVVQHPPEAPGRPAIDEMELELLDQHGAWSDDCLVLECQPQEQGRLSVSLSFDDEAVSEEDIRWMAHHFGRLLLALVAQPGYRIENLDMAGPEIIQQAHLWNNHPIRTSDQRIERLFHDRFGSWSSLTAIDATDATLTYQELDDLSSNLAYKLIAHGLSRGDLVPFCVKKSAVMIVAILAVRKTGCAYVPLEIDLPLERMQLIVQNLSAYFIICTPRQEALCEGLGCSTITLDMNRLRRLPTSGSTGIPKCVMMEHSALSTTILERASRLGYTPGLRCVLYSSYAFDSSVWEIFAPLTHGGCLFIPANEQRLAALPQYLNDKRIQVFASTPTIVQNILHSPSQVPHLETVDLGGEAKPKRVVEEWSGKVRLINDYGPTETCINACMNDNILPGTDPNNIGYAQGDATHLWVVGLTDCSRLAPVGCVGQLLISGPTLARGYLNNPDKTAEAFIDCSSYPWVKAGDERCYVTGDLVRRNGNGSLTYCGRKDTQIQLYGNRIEVGEIEHNLAGCEGIRLVAVERVFRDNSDAEMLVAFMTLDGKGSQHASESFLRPDDAIRTLINGAASKLSGALPKYMVPRLYLPMHAMPLTVGGKIDRKSLGKAYKSIAPELLAEYSGRTASKRVPRTEIQKTLQGLWSQVLGVSIEEIGLDDEFGILGGDSLDAIKLASKAMGIGFGLSVSTLLQFSRFEDMAAAMRPGRSSIASVAESKDPVSFSLLDHTSLVENWNKQDGIEDVFPAASMQTAFTIRGQRWYRPCYFWFFIDIDQRISPGCLQSACEWIVQKYQILRTKFQLAGSSCYQVVEKHTKADFKALKSPGEMNAACCHLIDQDGNLPIQFGCSSTRFRLVVDENTGDQRLGVGMSHAQYDGFCTDFMLSGLYSYCTGTGAQDRSKPPSYSRFVRYTQQISQKAAADRFWARNLQGSTMTHIGRPSTVEDLPADHSIERVRFSIDRRPGGMSFATVMKTAWSLVLARISNSSNVTFGSIVSGRNAAFEGADKVFGPCLNLLPVHVDFDDDITFHNLMKQVHEQQVATIPYEATPIEQIIQQSPWPRTTRFGSMVLHQNIPPTSVSQDGRSDVDGELKWKYAGAAGYGDAIFDFTDCWITTMPADDKSMKCWLTYNEERLSTANANIILDYFLDIIDTIFEHPDRHVKSLEGTKFDIDLGEGGGDETQVAAASSSSFSKTQHSENNIVPTLTPEVQRLKSQLQGLWKEVLQVKEPDPQSIEECNAQSIEAFEIEPTTSFFDLGGNSLDVAHLSTLCTNAGLELTIQDIFDYPNIPAQYEVLLGLRARKQRIRPKLVFVSEKEIPA